MSPRLPGSSYPQALSRCSSFFEDLSYKRGIWWSRWLSRGSGHRNLLGDEQCKLHCIRFFIKPRAVFIPWEQTRSCALPDLGSSSCLTWAAACAHPNPMLFAFDHCPSRHDGQAGWQDPLPDDLLCRQVTFHHQQNKREPPSPPQLDDSRKCSL